MIEIEIKGHYGQFIKGFLKRVVEDKGVIQYADDPSSEELMPLCELRLPPANDSGNIVEELNIIEKKQFPERCLAPQLCVEAMLPVSAQENPQDNSFTEALSNLQVSQSVKQPSASSRLANPFACLTCPSWWPCVVTKVRDAHAVVQLRPVLPATSESAPPPPKEYTDLATTLSAMTEICERKMLRPATSPDAPSLTPDSLFTHKIAIPQDLLPYASDLAVHESILRHCGEPVSLSFENDHLVVLSPSPEVIRVVGLLEEMHLRMLRQKCGIMRYISQAKKLQEGQGGSKDGSAANTVVDGSNWSSADEGHFVETFSVPSSLMGLAIGAQGANIRTARSISGVVRIEVHEATAQRNGGYTSPESGPENMTHESTFGEVSLAHFKVVAETPEAAKIARATLEFCEVCLLVPKRLIGRVVGNRTQNILSITEKSGVRHIHLESESKSLPKPVDSPESLSQGRIPTCLKLEDKHPELASASEKNEFSGFFVVGTRDAVEKARLLITFQIDCIFELEKLEVAKLDLLRELPGRNTGGPYHGPPQHETMNHAGNGGVPPQRNRGPRGGPPPRGAAAGDLYHEEAQRSNNQQPMNRGGGARRNQRRQPPRSAGDVSDAQRGSTSPHPDGLVNAAAAATSAPMADDKKAIEEPITTGRRRRAGSGAGTSEPAVAGPQRGGRPRNRGGNLEGGGNSRGGPVANASAPDRGTEECNGVTKTEGAERSGMKKENRKDNNAAIQQNGKHHHHHPVNNAAEVANP